MAKILFDTKAQDGKIHKEEIELGEEVTKITPKIIGENFKDASNIIRLEIMGGVHEIAMGSFDKFKNLETVELAKSVRKVYAGAFGKCDNLQEVVLINRKAELCCGAFPHGTKIVSYFDI